MSVRIGFLMLVHDALDRAGQVARFWHDAGCPVVIHVDSRVPKAENDKLTAMLDGLADVHFVRRQHCEWGTWSLVDASQAAAGLMLELHPDVTHVYLASGACLPLRPVSDLNAYIERRPGTDFIESVAVEDVAWAKGGLDEERFQYSFPFSWKRQRRLFDRSVRFQRLVGRRRAMPDGLQPHLGSQWWCLTRATLKRIMADPRRQELERYFRRVWIPDESYYQTLVRLYGAKVESRSLTLSKFDFQGKPHIFYDDHKDMLRRSECFVARKIWPEAESLYADFLSGQRAPSQAEPEPGEIDRVFARAVDRRTRGRDGLNSAARFPSKTHEHGLTAACYRLYQGFDHLFEDFADWARSTARVCVHGHLFAPDRAEFVGGATSYAGGLTDAADLRDYNPEAFLQNLIWNTRGEPQGFLFGPADEQKITRFVARDPNASIAMVTGAWAVPLFRHGGGAQAVRKEAALQQRREAAFLNLLGRPETRARVHIWTLAAFLQHPSEVLLTLVEEASPMGASPLTAAPVMHALTGLADFLQDLKNQGLQLHTAGDVTEGAGIGGVAPVRRILR